MSVLKSSVLVALGFISGVLSHGHCPKLYAGGKEYPGYDPYPYEQATNPTCGWRDPGIVHTAFINPDKYGDEDIICHIDATHATEYVEIEAGEDLIIQWTPWPVSHHGPVITYMASCNGDCLTVNKADLEFHKMDAVGQIVTGKTNSDPGRWASDDLIANDNKYSFKVPACVKPGPYIVRHEIIALMGASKPNGAQHYPNCINVMVKGSGTDALEGGTKGTDLYKATDPGVSIMIYGPINYIIPGPELYTCGAGGNKVPTPDKSTTTAAGVSQTTASGTSQSTPSGIPQRYSGNQTSISPSGTAPGYSVYGTGSATPYGSNPTPTPKSDGGNTYGGKTYGDKTNGGKTYGDKTNGGKTYGDKTYGDKTNGGKTYGDKTNGGKTYGDKTNGGKTYGGKTYGGKTNGHNTNTNSYTSPKSNIATGSTNNASDFSIPADATISQLLAWLEKIVTILKSKLLGKNYRRHARDVTAI